MKKLLFLWLAACSSTAENGTIAVVDIDPAGYEASVHPVVQQRCGSAECHGNLARGMRVGDVRTTYQSILALEPEKTDAFAADRTEANAYDLLFLAKPLARERHRPGASLTKGEPAERCLTSWLVGPVDAKICSDARVK